MQTNLNSERYELGQGSEAFVLCVCVLCVFVLCVCVLVASRSDHEYSSRPRSRDVMQRFGFVAGKTERQPSQGLVSVHPRD